LSILQLTHPTVSDVMINSAYLKKCQEKDIHFMAFTVLVVLGDVKDKFDKKHDTENYNVLKNRIIHIFIYILYTSLYCTNVRKIYV